MLETNTDETKNQDTKRVEILFDLKGDSYEISNITDVKQFICVCGSCDLRIEKDGHIENITLNHPSVTIKVEPDTFIKLQNYTKYTKIILEYLHKMRD